MTTEAHTLTTAVRAEIMRLRADGMDAALRGEPELANALRAVATRLEERLDSDAEHGCEECRELMARLRRICL